MLLSELIQKEDRSRAVGTADDGDSCCLSSVESHENSEEVCQVDTKLCCCTHDKADRVCNQRTEVCHRTYAHEDQGWEDTPLVQSKEIVEQTARMLKTLYVGIRLSHDVRVNVYKQHTECDRYKKQRLKFMLNRKIQEEASHCDHNVIAPVQIKKRRLVKQVV